MRVGTGSHLAHLDLPLLGIAPVSTAKQQELQPQTQKLSPGSSQRCLAVWPPGGCGTARRCAQQRCCCARCLTPERGGQPWWERASQKASVHLSEFRQPASHQCDLAAATQRLCIAGTAAQQQPAPASSCHSKLQHTYVPCRGTGAWQNFTAEYSGPHEHCGNKVGADAESTSRTTQPASTSAMPVHSELFQGTVPGQTHG